MIGSNRGVFQEPKHLICKENLYQFQPQESIDQDSKLQSHNRNDKVWSYYLYQ